jgi:hemerythrin-like domain-containing protein
MQDAPGAAAWHEEHVYFGRLLDLLDSEVEVFAAGERPDYPLMFDILEYLREYADRYHHPREDAVFAILERREPWLAPVLMQLRQQHRVIARAGQALAADLDRAIDGALVARSDIEAAAATYVLYYRHHIATEESEAVSRAAANLTDHEWQSIAASAAVIFDPLFGASPHERYRELLHRLGERRP